MQNWNISLQLKLQITIEILHMYVGANLFIEMQRFATPQIVGGEEDRHQNEYAHLKQKLYCYWIFEQ